MSFLCVSFELKYNFTAIYLLVAISIWSKITSNQFLIFHRSENYAQEFVIYIKINFNKVPNKCILIEEVNSLLYVTEPGQWQKK